MKRLTSRERVALCVLAALALSTPAIHAGEEPVASDKVGTMTIDTDSVHPDGRYVRADFWAYTGNARIPVAALIDGCEKKSGKISYKVLDLQDPNNATNASRWYIGGERVIDKMASVACQHAKRG